MRWHRDVAKYGRKAHTAILYSTAQFVSELLQRFLGKRAVAIPGYTSAILCGGPAPRAEELAITYQLPLPR